MMDAPKIKICGMRNPENIREVAGLKPDLMGFILYPPSKRFLGEDYELETQIPKSIQRVGVFVNALLNDIMVWKNRLGLHYAQIHGDESPEYCLELKEMGLPVIKSFGVGGSFDFSRLEPYLDHCEFFLFDTKCEERGGSGRQFDWQLLAGYPFEKPFFLSGGIGPEDAASIKEVRNLPLYAVDINSRFEKSPGLKDVAAINSFISELREV